MISEIIIIIYIIYILIEIVINLSNNPIRGKKFLWNTIKFLNMMPRKVFFILHILNHITYTFYCNTFNWISEVRFVLYPTCSIFSRSPSCSLYLLLTSSIYLFIFFFKSFSCPFDEIKIHNNEFGFL